MRKQDPDWLDPDLYAREHLRLKLDRYAKINQGLWRGGRIRPPGQRHGAGRTPLYGPDECVRGSTLAE
jgi:hypothetical protein